MERKKVERKLKEALAAKADLVNMVSHDLRIPLTAIKEGIDIVGSGEAGAVNEEQKEFLDLAKRNVERLTRLITDFLDFEKIDADKQQFNIVENDINELVKDVHKTMGPVARQKGLDFRVELDEGLPKTEFDYDGITRVVTNLVSNALKFTTEGSIVIRTRKDESGIEVAIADTGCGISKDDVGKLFQEIRANQVNEGKRHRRHGAGACNFKADYRAPQGKNLGRIRTGQRNNVLLLFARLMCQQRTYPAANRNIKQNEDRFCSRHNRRESALPASARVLVFANPGDSFSLLKVFVRSRLLRGRSRILSGLAEYIVDSIEKDLRIVGLLQIRIDAFGQDDFAYTSRWSSRSGQQHALFGCCRKFAVCAGR